MDGEEGAHGHQLAHVAHVAHPAAVGSFPQAWVKPNGCLVLVVDDEPLIRWSLTETLAGLGFAVMEAGDARAALRAVSLANTPIDAILLDFRLPDENGFALFKELHALRPSSPIIIMTAFGTREMTEQALDLGAYAVVSKPFEVDALASLVGTAIGSSH